MELQCGAAQESRQLLIYATAAVWMAPQRAEGVAPLFQPRLSLLAQPPRAPLVLWRIDYRRIAQLQQFSRLIFIGRFAVSDGWERCRCPRA